MSSEVNARNKPRAMKEENKKVHRIILSTQAQSLIKLSCLPVHFFVIIQVLTRGHIF